MKIFLALFALISFLVSPALSLYQVDFPSSLIGKTFKSVTRLKETGEVVGQGESKIEKTASDGKDFIVIKSKGSMTFKGHTFSSQVTKFYSYEKGRISVYSIEGRTDKDGKPYQNYLSNFDWPNKFATFTYNDLEKKENKQKSIKLETKMISVQDLELYLSTLPARNIKEDSVKALLPNGNSLGFLLKVQNGREVVKVNGKDIFCYRVELKPDLGLLSLVIPNVNYWLRSTPPHTLVRYAGLMSGPGSPDIIQDISD